MDETKAERPEGPLECLVGRKRDQSLALHDLALTLGARPGWERESNVVSVEAARLDREVDALLADNDYYQPEEAKRPIPAALRKQWGMPVPNDGLSGPSERSE